MEALDQVSFVWSLLLLPATAVLNVSGFLLLLRGAGSCRADSIVAPLLSVLGRHVSGV